MILPQSARKLADSSLGEGAQRECFNRGFVLTKFADSSPGEGAQRECFDGGISLVEGGAELTKRREFIYTIMR